MSLDGRNGSIRAGRRRTQFGQERTLAGAHRLTDLTDHVAKRQVSSLIL